MLISTALLLDSIIRNSVCTPAKLPCRRVEVGYEIIRKGFNVSIVCLNYKFPPTLHSRLEIQPATPFGKKCVRLYLLGYLSISVFKTQNFRTKEKSENLF
jgi:hypothetical protein